MSTVNVNLCDLAAMGDLICCMDSRTEAPSIEQIGQAHDLVIKMMGEHANRFYAPEDEAEAAP